MPLLAQFQGALAILERLSRTGAIPEAALEPLAMSLIAVAFEDDQYRGRVAEWMPDATAPGATGRCRTDG